MTQLPPGWAETSVGSVSQFVRGVTYKRDEARSENAEGFLPLLRATNIDGSATTNETQLVYVPESVVSTDQVLQDEDIVMATSSGSISVVGKSATWLGGKPTTFGAFCGVLRATDGVNPRYLAHYVRSARVRSRWSELASGTNINNLKRDHVLETPVPLPPLAEQQRIVEAIEERFSRLDAAGLSLRRARGRLATFRHLTLTNAVSGAWPMVELGDIAMTLRNGAFVSRPAPQGPGVRIFRISAVRPLRLDVDDVRFAQKERSEVKPYFVQAGDLLFTRYNGNPNLVGACAVVPDGCPPTIHPDKLIRVVVDTSRADPAFIALAVNFGEGRAAIAQRLKTTAGQVGIAGGQLRSVPVPLPPLDVQRSIVERVGAEVAAFDRLQAALIQAEQRAAQLRRSVLGQAFVGNLVEQDPADESAITTGGQAPSSSRHSAQARHTDQE